MALFQKQRPIDKFNKNYSDIQMVLFKMFADNRQLIEEKLNMSFKSDDFDAIVGLCLNYLLGHDIQMPTTTASSHARAVHKRMVNKIPTLAMKLYKLDNMEPVFSAILDYKNSTLTMLLGNAWTDTPEARRVNELIKSSPASIKDTEEYKDIREWLNNL